MQRRPEEYQTIAGTLEALQLAIEAGHFDQYGGLRYIDGNPPPKKDPIVHGIAKEFVDKANTLFPDFAIQMPNILAVQFGDYSYGYDRLIRPMQSASSILNQ